MCEILNVFVHDLIWLQNGLLLLCVYFKRIQFAFLRFDTSPFLPLIRLILPSPLLSSIGSFASLLSHAPYWNSFYLCQNQNRRQLPREKIGAPIEVVERKSVAYTNAGLKMHKPIPPKNKAFSSSECPLDSTLPPLVPPNQIEYCLCPFTSLLMP